MFSIELDKFQRITEKEIYENFLFLCDIDDPASWVPIIFESWFNFLPSSSNKQSSVSLKFGLLRDYNLLSQGITDIYRLEVYDETYSVKNPYPLSMDWGFKYDFHYKDLLIKW